MKCQMRFRTKQALTPWQIGYVPCSRHRTLQRNWGDDTPVWVADTSSQETACSWYGVLPRGFSIRHEKSQEMHVKIVFCIYKKVNCINFNLKKKKAVQNWVKEASGHVHTTDFSMGYQRIALDLCHDCCSFGLGYPTHLCQWVKCSQTFLHNVNFNSEKMHAVVYSANYDTFSYTYTYWRQTKVCNKYIREPGLRDTTLRNN